MKNVAEIVLALRSDIRGATEAISALRSVRQESSRVREGFALAAGVGGAWGLKEALVQGAKASFLFNSNIEDTQLGLAGIYRQFKPEEFKTLDAGLLQSAKTVQQLKKAALETKASFGEMLGAYQSIAGAAFAAGIPMEKQVRLTQLFASAVSGLGLPSWQLPQEARSILTGTIGPDSTVAKALGITNDEINRAKAAGRVMEYLEERLKGLDEAGRRTNQTFSGRWAAIKDQVEQMFGTAGEPAFESLKGAFAQIQATLSKPEVQQGLNNLGALAAKGIEMGAGVVGNDQTMEDVMSLANVAVGISLGTAAGSLLGKLLPSASKIGFGTGAAWQIGKNTLTGLAQNGSAAPLNSILARLTAGGGVLSGLTGGGLLAELGATGSASTMLASIGALGSAGLIGGTAIAGLGIGYGSRSLLGDRRIAFLQNALGILSDEDYEGILTAEMDGEGGNSGLDKLLEKMRAKRSVGFTASTKASVETPDPAELAHRLKLGRDQLEFDYQEKLIDLKNYIQLRREFLKREGDTKTDPVERRRLLGAGNQEIDQVNLKAVIERERERSQGLFDRLRIKTESNGGRFSSWGQVFGFQNSLPTFQAMLSELRAIKAEIRNSQPQLT